MGKELVHTKTVIGLIEKIRNEIENGRMKIEKVIDNEKTITYWNIGKHIYQHFLEYSQRAKYRDSLFALISDELNIGKSTLHRAVLFYETYPKIMAPVPQLTWCHYRILITVKDEEKRKEFEQLIINNGISKRELQDLVNKYRKEKNNKKYKLSERRGLPYCYKLEPITEEGNTLLYIDLGFRVYIDKLDKRIKYNEHDIIQRNKRITGNEIIRIDKFSSQMLYTYKGFVKSIIDGDTLWINLNLGFKTRTLQKVRLRGLNAPIIETEEGKKAKQYLENTLKQCKFIIAKTYWRDKYNRYLVDIFYDKKETDIIKVAENGIYLNQELIDKGIVNKYKKN